MKIKRGANFGVLLKRLSLALVLILSSFAINIKSAIPAHAAAGTLELVRDTLNNDVPSSTGVTHEISLTLPVDATQIRPSDYLILDFPDFADVTIPTEISGAFGSPIFSINGTRARITNIALLPGTSLIVTGITATNPGSEHNYRVIISVADDEAGTSIRNQVITVASMSTIYTSVSATVESQMSGVSISGFTAPGSFVTLQENNSVLGTTSADGAGNFSFPISGLNPGDHTFNISSVDNQNRPTAQSVVQLYLLEGTLTSTTGILLSPTIQLNTDTINPGDPLIISGSSKPNSQVNIFTESPLRSYSATSDVDGNWTHTLDTNETKNYLPGQYRTYTNVQDGVGNQSITSNTLNFTVKTPTTDTNNPQPACNISHGDLNCDSKVNLTDFSILLYYWKTGQHRADINNDGNVNLVDFSIMMFYYQR